MKDDLFYLNNIKECIERVYYYIKDGKEVFLETTIIQDAVYRNIDIICESVKRLSQDLKLNYRKYISWSKVSMMRDMLVDNSFNIQHFAYK